MLRIKVKFKFFLRLFVCQVCQPFLCNNLNFQYFSSGQKVSNKVYWAMTHYGLVQIVELSNNWTYYCQRKIKNSTVFETNIQIFNGCKLYWYYPCADQIIFLSQYSKRSRRRIFKTIAWLNKFPNFTDFEVHWFFVMHVCQNLHLD